MTIGRSRVLLVVSKGIRRRRKRPYIQERIASNCRSRRDGRQFDPINRSAGDQDRRRYDQGEGARLNYRHGIPKSQQRAQLGQAGRSHGGCALVVCGARIERCDRSGGVVGGQIGHRWQSSQWVFGVEARGVGLISGTRVSA